MVFKLLSACLCWLIVSWGLGYPRMLSVCHHSLELPMLDAAETFDGTLKLMDQIVELREQLEQGCMHGG